MRLSRFARTLHVTLILGLLLGPTGLFGIHPAQVVAAPIQPQSFPEDNQAGEVRTVDADLIATMSDTVIDDNGSDRVDAGDRIRYTMQVTNTGDMDAENVSVDAELDDNVTFVTGSVATTPLARNDVFTVTENSTNTILAVLADNGQGADTDADADSLTITTVGAPDQGGTAANLGTTVAYTPAVDFTGVETFDYTIEDDDGNASTATVTVNVSEEIPTPPTNNPPTAVDDGAAVDEDDGATNIDVLANDSDPDSGDTKEVVAVHTSGVSGTVVISSTGPGNSVTYDPGGQFESLAAGASATELFSYTMQDSQGVTATAQVSITVNGSNDAPIAQDDTFNVAEDATNVSLDVLADNGNGPDSDVDDAILSIDSVGMPDSGGTVANLATSIAYTPAVDFSGSEVFTYTVIDGVGASDSATVTVVITPDNDAPFFISIPVTGAVQGVLYTYNINTDDPDLGDTRTISATTKPVWTAFGDNGNGSATLSGTPGDADVGDHSVVLQVEDAGGLSATQTFTLSVSNVNDPPIAGDDSAGVNEDDGATHIDVLDNDIDVDSGDTKEVVSTNATGISGTVVISGSGPGNSVTYDPNGQFNSLSQGVTATEVFSYTMQDSLGVQSTARVTVTITGENDAPLAASQQVSATGNISITVPDGSDDLLAGSSDPDSGDSLTVQSVDITSAQGGDVALVNAGTGSYTYNPPPGFEGTDVFSYTLTDGNGGSVTTTVTVSVTDMIWFIDNSQGTDGDGRLGSPFNNLASFEALNGNGGSSDPEAGDSLFLYETGSGDYTGGLTLENNQILVGQGASASLTSITGITTPVYSSDLPATGGAKPNVTNAAGNGITLANANTIHGLEVSGATGAGIIGQSKSGGDLVEVDVINNSGVEVLLELHSGTFAMLDSTIVCVAPPDNAVHIQGGSAAITLTNTSIVHGGGAAVSVTGTTGGSLSVTGGITQTNGVGLYIANSVGTYTVDAIHVDGVGVTNGINLSSVTGDTTIASLQIDGGPGAGLFMSNITGVVTVGPGSFISGTTGVALQSLGSGTLVYSGTITQTTNATAVSIANKSSGSAIFSGPIVASTGTASAIDLSNNVGATLNFDGGLDIDTTSGIGFSATGGGTLNITGSGNTIATTGTGRAIVLNGVTLGANDVTFASISTSGTPAADALSFTNVSNAGTFNGGVVTVAGTSGGDGIEINGSLATFNFASATIDNTAGAGINLVGLNGGVTFTTVDIDGTTGPGLAVTNNTNAVNVNGGSIGATNDPAANAVDIDQGSGNVTIAASVGKTTAGEVAEVTNRSGGTVVLSGNLSCTSGCTGLNVTNNTAGTTSFSGAAKTLNTGTNAAVTLSSNTGATVNFTNGGLDIDTTTGTGFNATGGGTVNVTGGGNTIDTTRTAVNLEDITIGGADVTFQSINVNGGSTSTSPAINLDDTGAGLFSVTGDGTTNGSGGTIQDVLEDGIRLFNTDGAVSISNMVIEDIGRTDTASPGHHAIDGQQVDGGLTLDNVTIQRVTDSAIHGEAPGGGSTTWNGLSLTDSTLAFSNRFHISGVADGGATDEAMVTIEGISGTVLVRGNDFANGPGFVNLFTANNGSVDITVQNNTFEDGRKDLPNVPSVGSTGVRVNTTGTIDAAIRIGDPAETNSALGNTFTDTGSDAAIIVSGFSSTDDANVDLVISRNSSTVLDHTSPPGLCVSLASCAFDFPNGGIGVESRGSGTFEAIISHNTLVETQNSGGLSTGSLRVDVSGADTEVIVRNNTITRAWDGPLFIRADNTDGNDATGQLLVQDNVYTAGLIGVPSSGDDLDTIGAANSPSPFLPNRFQVRNGAVLDLTVINDDMVSHDTSVNPQFDSLDMRINGDTASGGSSSVFNVLIQDTEAPEGFRFRNDDSGDSEFNLARGLSTDPAATDIIAAQAESVLTDNGNTTGGGSPTADVPTSGVNIVTSPPTLPIVTAPVAASSHVNAHQKLAQIPIYVEHTVSILGQRGETTGVAGAEYANLPLRRNSDAIQNNLLHQETGVQLISAGGQYGSASHVQWAVTGQTPATVRQQPTAGDEIVTVAIGTLPAGKSVTIQFVVRIADPLPAELTEIALQGTISASNAESVLTDDPDTPAPLDPTVTLLSSGSDGKDDDAERYLPVIVTGPRVVYTTDFAQDPSNEWSQITRATSPSGERFLGEFGNESATLTLDNLPAHNRVTVAFDLYILRSWDGNQESLPASEAVYAEVGVTAIQGEIGPDRWQLQADGQTLLDTTFTNWPAFRQAYPDGYPGGDNLAQTGTVEVNSLDYVFAIRPMDAVYRIERSFDHSDPSLSLDFSALGLQDLDDESWGLDNVVVMVGKE